MEHRMEATGGRGADPPVPLGDPATTAPRPAAQAAARFADEALRWLPDVARFARSLTGDASDAEDLAQETFLRAARGWHTFRPGTDVRRWLFTICHHEFVRSYRRERIYVHPRDDAETETLSAVHLHVQAREAGLNDLFTRLDLGPALARALAALPATFRQAVQLVDVEGLSYEDAAHVLDVPVGTVRSRLFRGRRLLQQDLIAYAQDAGLARPPGRPRVEPGGAERRPTEGSGDD